MPMLDPSPPRARRPRGRTRHLRWRVGCTVGCGSGRRLCNKNNGRLRVLRVWLARYAYGAAGDGRPPSTRDNSLLLCTRREKTRNTRHLASNSGLLTRNQLATRVATYLQPAERSIPTHGSFRHIAASPREIRPPVDACSGVSGWCLISLMLLLFPINDGCPEACGSFRHFGCPAGNSTPGGSPVVRAQKEGNGGNGGNGVTR